MGKPNYNHAKRQKEAVRKERQQAKLARRQARKDDEAAALQPGAPAEAQGDAPQGLLLPEGGK